MARMTLCNEPRKQRIAGDGHDGGIVVIAAFLDEERARMVDGGARCGAGVRGSWNGFRRSSRPYPPPNYPMPDEATRSAPSGSRVSSVRMATSRRTSSTASIGRLTGSGGRSRRIDATDKSWSVARPESEQESRPRTVS